MTPTRKYTCMVSKFQLMDQKVLLHVIIILCNLASIYCGIFIFESI